jgi:hypothetical protein
MNRRTTPLSPAAVLFVAVLATGTATATANACDPAAPATAHAAPTSTVLHSALAPAPALPDLSPFSNPGIPLYLALAGAPAPVAGGLLAFLDPETGMIGGMPSPLSAEFLASSPEGLTVDDLVEEAAWDGSVMINLRGLFQEYAVLRIAADGRRVAACGPDPRALLAPSLPPAPPQAAPVVEE